MGPPRPGRSAGLYRGRQVIAPDDPLRIDDETRLVMRRLSRLRTMRRWCPESQRSAFDGLIDEALRQMRGRMFGVPPAPPAPLNRPKRPGGDGRKHSHGRP
jgi:hypothetical protein